jgi:hypothetical protein
MTILELDGRLKCVWCDTTFSLDAPWTLVNEHDKSHRKYYDMIDCIQFECYDNACSFKGRVSSADICRENDTVLVRFHDNLYPMCEHIWSKAKAHLDFGLKEAKEENPPEEAQRWFCHFCNTRIPLMMERCPSCGSDLSKFVAEYKARLAKVEAINKRIRRE